MEKQNKALNISALVSNLKITNTKNTTGYLLLCGVADNIYSTNRHERLSIKNIEYYYNIQYGSVYSLTDDGYCSNKEVKLMAVANLEEKSRYWSVLEKDTKIKFIIPNDVEIKNILGENFIKNITDIKTTIKDATPTELNNSTMHILDEYNNYLEQYVILEIAVNFDSRIHHNINVLIIDKNEDKYTYYMKTLYDIIKTNDGYVMGQEQLFRNLEQHYKFLIRETDKNKICKTRTRTINKNTSPFI